VKARDVRVGDTVRCCAGSNWCPGRSVVVARIEQPPGSTFIAFGYHDDTKAARDTFGITVGYRPDAEVGS
jgi:hypothetical protein